MNDEQRHQEWITQRKAEEAKRRERSAECLKGHEYTVLADTDQLTVWRCKAPGTSCYAFDIMITRFGIAIVGDINGLTFNVGLTYGIEFLAGNDIGYYIHSKLEEHCREREFDEEAFRAALVTGVCSQICENTHDDEITPTCPSGCGMTAVAVKQADGMSCEAWSRIGSQQSNTAKTSANSGIP